MKAVKKYWWVIALALVLLFLLFGSKTISDSQKKKKKGGSSEGSGCKTIGWEEFKGKKQFYYDSNGGNWTLAHAQVLDEGYCEHTGT